ncbi:MAG: arginine--tRNA ligase [Candidatus Aureabacteria bacterium]|nr:arginine--tRNA ligase [Candidatus Auribacterota bacterium]
MRTTIRDRIESALGESCRGIAGDPAPQIVLETPRDPRHGDLATNLALRIAREKGGKAREIAEQIAVALKGNSNFCPPLCERIEIAGPGFINLFIAPQALQGELALILSEGDRYGASAREGRAKIQLEFVSANPTGPLTVAHGRQAAVGDSLARILSRAGYSVMKEYYLNDRGKQIRLLGHSTLQRYREIFGQKAEIPDEGYKGSYIKDLAERVRVRDGDLWLRAGEEEAIAFFSNCAVEEITAGIVKDLADFHVAFDHWTREREFSESGKIETCIEFLRGRDLIYEKDGAIWFRTESLGDDKDRVLVKSDGERTYFAPDIAYHRDKFEQGFDRVIDFWGPDHHGYVARMRAAVRALGYSDARFTPVIVQLSTLFRGAQKLSMSTRAGEFITLRELMDEVGVDATRYFFARMRTESHLNFDLDLAKKRSNDNPVYYVQYVHARVCSMYKKLNEKKPGFSLPAWENVRFDLLREREERDLIKRLSDFPLAVEQSAAALEPNLICNYMEDLAAAFHQCYTEHTVISEDDSLTAARMGLAEGVRIIVRNGLDLLGVAAPESM